ncbi:MAG: zinc-binding alcohol dehydrogenase [Candidatus Poribacteria bacterium]|nr:zinc-binding alcohol dehydrogenase [Candidatus Poribacteria bacterium]
MHAKGLICDENQNFSYADVILPNPGPGHILVRTLFTGVSIGTEFAIIRNKLSWGAYPLCTGYQGIGSVEAVGEEVRGFRVGDNVYFRDNKAGMQLTDGKQVSTVSGTHCSYALIHPQETHGVALLPEGADAESASLFVMPAVGLNGVDMANPRMGDVVAVYGSGLIGLGVVAACSHRGCVVVAIDLEPNRLDIARRLGADDVINGATQDVLPELKRIAPDGADVVFECTGIPGCIDPAIELCKMHGKFVLQGNYGEKPISYQFLPPHGKRLTTFYPCDDGFAPCRRAVVKNMAMGVLPWHHTITHRVDAKDAPELYDAINKGKAADVVGAVLRWS